MKKIEDRFWGVWRVVEKTTKPIKMSEYKCIKCGIDCGDDAYLCEEDNECFCKTCFDTISDKYDVTPDESVEEPKMIIYANFTAQARYDIPSDVKLLSNEDNESNNGERTPGAWWVKYNSLYYYDENLKICEIDPTYPAEVDDKYPLDYTVDYD